LNRGQLGIDESACLGNALEVQHHHWFNGCLVTVVLVLQHLILHVLQSVLDNMRVLRLAKEDGRGLVH
jgi:hypothetical protein